jgi:hypothetical protein
VTEGTFISRVWPSLVALVGTLAVVFGLLYVFGDNSGSSGEDDLAAEDPAFSELGDDDVGSDDDAADEGEDSGDDVSEESEPGDGELPDPVEAPDELKTPVGILNSTAIAGLAAGAQQRFTDGGWPVPVIADYSGQIAGTTVYYPTEELRESAEALRGQFPEVGLVEPTIGGLARDRLVVVLADDYAEAVGTTQGSTGTG